MPKDNTDSHSDELKNHLATALEPITSRVRTDVTAKKSNGKMIWTKEPLTKERLLTHVADGASRGCCPIKNGEETTRLALFDLDSHKGETLWPNMQQVAREVITELEKHGLYAVAFRSSGGKGIHLFMIWDQPQDAFSVRHFLTRIIANLGYKNGTAGVANKEIEIFPKQDSVPPNGYGNQFILPLAGLSVPLLEILDYDAGEREDALTIEWKISAPVPLLEKEEAKPKAEKNISGTTEFAVIESALAKIDPDAGYDNWYKIGMALHAGTKGGEDGLMAWNNWSLPALTYPGRIALEAKWNSFRNDKDRSITIGFIKKLAAEAGWVEDYSVDFEDVSDETTKREDEQKRKRYMPIRADDFAKRPPIKWIVKGILPEGEGMTFGASGCGKTFAAIDLACHVALGIDWNGHKTTCGHVVYICAEGAGGFTTRLKAWAQHYKVSLKDIGDFLTIIPDTPDFRNENDVKLLAKQINTCNKATALILIDTLAQVTAGADENSSKEMGQALRHAKLLGELTGSTYHLIHHTGKDEGKGARGSSVMKGQLDCMFCVSRREGKHTFWIEKMKDGRDNFGYDFDLATIVVQDDNAEDGILESCVVKYLGQSNCQKKRTLSPWKKRILDAANTLGIQSGMSIPKEQILAKAIASVPYDPGTDPTKPKRDSRRDSAERGLDGLAKASLILINNGMVSLPQFRNSSQLGDCGTAA